MVRKLRPFSLLGWTIVFHFAFRDINFYLFLHHPSVVPLSRDCLFLAAWEGKGLVLAKRKGTHSTSRIALVKGDGDSITDEIIWRPRAGGRTLMNKLI